jgi:hypothetical protein
MYINKGIYTYIPNPDPDPRTPKPEPRMARWPRLDEENEQLFGLLSQAAGMQREDTRRQKCPGDACLVVSALV